jgi:uncharacterized membrane protein
MPILTEPPEAPAPSGASSSEARAAPRLRLRLTPYKSLTPEGFVWFIGLTAALISVPLLSILGTSVFWALLPFIVAAVWAIWAALKRSWRDHELFEVVTLWDDLIRIERHEPRRREPLDGRPTPTGCAYRSTPRAGRCRTT